MELALKLFADNNISRKIIEDDIQQNSVKKRKIKILSSTSSTLSSTTATDVDKHTLKSTVESMRARITKISASGKSGPGSGMGPGSGTGPKSATGSGSKSGSGSGSKGNKLEEAVILANK